MFPLISAKPSVQNVTIQDDSNIYVDKLINDCLLRCGNEKYAELVAILGSLRALAILHQTHHWQAAGDSFFADHKLFEELYTASSDQIDPLAEKIVGLSGKAELVGFSKHVIGISSFLSEVKSHGTSDDPARRSLDAEKMFVALVESVMKRLEVRGLLTRGLENLLGGLADEHEKFIYLLGRRVSQ